MAKFDYNLHQEVWIPDRAFFRDPLPVWLKGTVIKRTTKKDGVDTKQIYTIKTEDGMYERDSLWVFESLEDLQEAVEDILHEDYDDADTEVWRLEEELKKAQAERTRTHKLLMQWRECCGKAAK